MTPPHGRSPLRISSCIASLFSPAGPSGLSLFALASADGHVFIARIPLAAAPALGELLRVQLEAAGAVISMADRALALPRGIAT